MISSKGFVLLPVLCVALFSILAGGCSERHQSFYPSLADADKGGEITRGWIPDYLPVSSRAIHIVYAPESPRTWCAFEFSPGDAQRLKENLKSVGALPPPVKRVASPGVPWWPAVLKGNLDVGNIHRSGLDLYVAEEPAHPANTDILLFAIDWTNGRAFFHRTNQ